MFSNHPQAVSHSTPSHQHQKSRDCNLVATERGVRARVVARLCPQLRGCLHHILVGCESRSSRGLLALRHLDTLPRAMRKEGSFTSCHKRHDLTRTVHHVPTMPMHEVLAKELRDFATVATRTRGGMREWHVVPCLLGPPSCGGVQHPCVASGGFHGRRRSQPHR